MGKAVCLTSKLGFYNDNELFFTVLEYEIAFVYLEIALVILIILNKK